MQRRSPACTHPPAPHGSHMAKKKTHLVEDEQLRSLPAVEECIEFLRVGLVAHEALERVIRQPGRECVLNFGLAPFVPRGELGHAAENSLPSRHWFHKRCRRYRRPLCYALLLRGPTPLLLGGSSDVGGRISHTFDEIFEEKNYPSVSLLRIFNSQFFFQQKIPTELTKFLVSSAGLRG